MIDHSYIIDLKSGAQPSLKGVIFGENAPTHLCISHWNHASDGLAEYRIYTPSPGVEEKRRAELAAREERRRIREAELEAARARKKEEDARNKILRAELSARRKAEDQARKKAAAEALRKERAERLERNLAAYRAAKEAGKKAKKPQGPRKRGPKKHYAPVPEGFVKQAQAAREAGLKEVTVGTYIKSGSIPCEVRGRFKYVRVADVIAERNKRKEAWNLYNKGLGQRRKEEMARQKGLSNVI